MSRASTITQATSEKITLATVEAKQRLFTFNLADSVYSRTLPNLVVALAADDTNLTKVDTPLVNPGEFHYDITSGTLYFRLEDDADPVNFEIIATYQLRFSSKSLTLPAPGVSGAIPNIGDDVFWDGRVKDSPGYKHKIGIDQALTSLVGEGTLKLQNNDAGLDSVFDRLIFENQRVVIYSWLQGLDPADARIIYRGRVTNKTFTTNEVTFTVKDQTFSLLDSPPLRAYQSGDEYLGSVYTNIAEANRGQILRRVYGRVDGLRCQGVEMIGNGIPLQSVGSMALESNIITINNEATSLSSIVSPFASEVVLEGDTVILGGQEFTVESTDFSGPFGSFRIITDQPTDFPFTALPMLIRPARGLSYPFIGRRFVATGHRCTQVLAQVIEIKQLNRVTVSDTAGLFPGDFVDFASIPQRVQIERVAPGNVLVLRQNLQARPPLGSFISREPIQDIFINGKRVRFEDYTIVNATDSCGFQFTADAELNITRAKRSSFNFTFTNGSRNVTASIGDVPLSDILQPGDYIRPDEDGYTTRYQIRGVGENSLTLVNPFGDTTITERALYWQPDFINDETVVSCNILGKSLDPATGAGWISTAAAAQLDLLQEQNLVDLNVASFTEASLQAPPIVSMAIPEDFTSKSIPTIKDITDRLNRTVQQSLTLDNNLLVKCQALYAKTGTNLVEISDKDVIQWGVKTTNGKTFRNVLARFSFKDYDVTTQDKGNDFYSVNSRFVDRYIKTNKASEIDLYLYNPEDAETWAQRYLYYNRLGFTTLTITTDLRLENLEIGDSVIADFARLYVRYGSEDFKKKVMLVVGKTVTGERVQLELSDLGNTFNASAFITENDAPDYATSTNQDRLVQGYITESNGIVDDNENSANTNLIG